MKKVLINAEERELRVAILEDDQLVELYIESLDEKSILNNMYKGRIEGIIPGLKAAFVNIGLERNAFLHFDDVRPDLLLAKAGLPPPAPARPELDADDISAPSPPAVAEEDDDEDEAEAEAEESAASPLEGEEREDGRRRRRRRGRRGGRRRREQEGTGSGVPPDGGEAEKDEDELAGGNQQPSHSSHSSQSSQQSRRDKRRDRRKDRGDRQPWGGQQSSPGNAWVPPPPGAERGTRAASNPYQDVFSPYGQQQGRRRWRKDQVDDRFNVRSGGRGQGARGESQEDFFPPPPRSRAAEFDEEDELQPQHLRHPGESYSPEEDEDGPQPGNERFPSQSQGRQGNSGKRRKRRGSRGRSMKKPGGSSYFAARAKKPIVEESPADVAPKKTARRKAADAPAEPAETEKKPKRATKAKATAEETPKKPASTQPKEPARRGKAAATPEKSVPPPVEEAKPKRTSRKRTEETPAPEVVPTPSRSVSGKAKPKAPARKGKKAADELPEGDLLAALTQAPPPPPSEAPEKPKRRRGAKASEEPGTPVAELPAVQAQPETPILEEEPAKAPARRARGRKTTAAAPPSGAAPVVETAPEAVLEPTATTDVPSTGETRDAAPVSHDRESRRDRRSRRGRGGKRAGDRAESTPSTADERSQEARVAELPQARSGQSIPVPQPETLVPGPAEERDRPREPRRERDRDRGRGRERDRDQARGSDRPERAERPDRSDRADRAERSDRRRLPRFTDVFQKGDEVMVQVVKEEIGMKGARISTFVSIPGRYLVLLPYPNEEGGVSRKVEDMNERKRLKRILRDISANDEHAFIIRTAGVDRDEEEIAGDVEFLRNEWKNIAARFESAKPGELVYDDHNILYRLARDVFDDNIGEILVDSAEVAGQLRDILGKLIPDLVDRVQVYDEGENIFQKFQVEKQITKAARRKVWLKSGGYIIIDEAEALTAIDVNSGKFVGKDDQEKMILKTNLEAAKAIARELKLRDIGGLIVIDFIDMKDQRNRDQLLAEFRQHLRKDRSKTAVSSVSEFGLVEMTRKRVRRSLRKTLFMDCPYCQGAGVILNEQQIWLHVKHEIIRLLEAGQPYPPSLSITMNPRVRTYIDQNYRETLHRLEQKYGVQIRMVISDVFHMENYAIEKLPREFAPAQSSPPAAAELGEGA